MKIKNFMKETGKKLKKHSYNAQSIMEEVSKNEVSAEEYTLKKRNDVPDSFYWFEDDEITYRRKTYPNVDVAFKDIKEGDLLLIREGKSRKIYMLFDDDYPIYRLEYFSIDESIGEGWQEFKDFYVTNLRHDYILGMIEIYKEIRGNRQYIKPTMDGSEFDEIDESDNIKLTASIMDVIKNSRINPDIIEDDDFGITYYKVDKTGDPEYDMSELKKMDLIVIRTDRLRAPTVGIYQGKTPGFAGLKLNVLLPIGDSYTIDQKNFGDTYFYWIWEHVDIYSPTKQPVYEKPPKDGSEYLDESARYFNMDRRTVVDKTDNTVYSWLPLSDAESEEEMYKELEKVQKGDVIFAKFNGEKGYYRINSPIRENSYVYIDTGHWSEYQIVSSSIVGMIRRNEAKIFIRNEDYDIGHGEKIDDSGEDWDEQLNERVQRGTYLRRHGVTYHKVDTNYIFDAETLYDMVKVNNTLLAGESIKYEVIGKWIGHDGTGYINIKKTTSMNDSTFTSKELFRQIENGYLTLWLPVGEAEAQSRPLDSDGSEFDEFDESYKPLKEDWQEQDEPGIGIIEYKGHKYYKVDAERHIHKQSDLMKYLVQGQTIFKANPNGKPLIYQDWQPQKVYGYKLNDDPYELNFRMDGDSKGEYAPFRFSFNAMYGMIVNVEHLFDVYIPEALAERTGIKDEWELTSGDEFDECVNLKGDELETLKEGTQIIGKKKMTILNKKGNHYNVLSEGKKYKYDIDNLKYDYSHKKVKIYSKD